MNFTQPTIDKLSSWISSIDYYITKNIIEAHNGEIILESKIELGTKITIFLPTKHEKS